MELITQIQLIEFSVYLITGAIAGTLAGLLGVGGGQFIVPVLLFSLPGLGIQSQHLLKIALATSLATIVFTSISSVLAHHRKGAVIWMLCLWLAPGMMIGAWSGAYFADWLAVESLTIFVGCAVILMGIQLFFGRQPEQARAPNNNLSYSFSGVLIGVISSMIGIGGGSMTVPLLHYWNNSMVRSVATSAACGFPIAVSGTMGFIIAGLDKTDLPAFSSGYVYWPAVIGIVASSFLFAPVGAAWAHQISSSRLKRYFGLFLLMVGTRILIDI